MKTVIRILKACARPFVWMWESKAEILAALIVLGCIGGCGYLFVDDMTASWKTEKIEKTASEITLHIEKECKQAIMGECKYHPYVTFINKNDREVTILMYRSYSDAPDENIDMFVLLPNETKKKYIGVRGKWLYKLDVLIKTNQGTVERVVLWDNS